MLLAPSDINFLRDATLQLFDDKFISAMTSKLIESNQRTVPRIQVTEKEGSWFALNNSYLYVCRELERRGQCGRIQVEVVPLSKVPSSFQKGMVVSNHQRTDHPRRSLPTVLQPTAVLENKVDTAIQTGSSTQGSTAAKDNRAHNKDPCRVTKKGYQKLADGAPEDKKTTGCDVTASGEVCETDSANSEVSEGDMEDSGSEYDEILTCNVCDRSFTSKRQLTQHQAKKRHFGCSVCDSQFQSLPVLERHKEELDHWSEDEEEEDERQVVAGGKSLSSRQSDESDDDDDEDDSESETDDDSDDGEKSEELERLL